MNREETKKAIEVMQAYVDGAEIEASDWDDDRWMAVPPVWDWVMNKYRVKPKPREFWIYPLENPVSVSSKPQPPGWIKVREVIDE